MLASDTERPDTRKNVSQLLTPREAAEISRLKSAPSVVGYVLMAPDGDVLEESGAWDDVAPVFANIFDLADRLGTGLGETSGCPAVTLENATHEISGVLLGTARAVIIRRKPRGPEEALRSVG